MERKPMSLTERFMKYRKSVSKQINLSENSTKKLKQQSIPEISYPSESDVVDELSNLVSFRKNFKSS